MVNFADLAQAQTSLRSSLERSPEKSAAVLLQELSDDSKSVADQLAVILHLINNEDSLIALARKDFEAVNQTAERILSFSRVDRKESKLSRAYEELLLGRARYEMAQGDFEKSLWALGSMRLTIPDAVHLQTVDALTGKLLLRLGEPHLAEVRFQASKDGPDEALRRQSNLGIALTRFCLAESTTSFNGESEAPRFVLLRGGEERLRAICDRNASTADRLLAKLWSYAVENRQLISASVRAETLQKKLGRDMQPAERRLYQIVRVLEDAYDNRIPLSLRLHDLGHIYGVRKSLAEFDWEILLTASIFRFAQRFSQEELAQMALSEYRASSLRWSAGRTNDLLQVSGAHEPLALIRAPNRPKSGMPKAGLLAAATKSVGIIMSNRLQRLTATEAQKEKLRSLELAKLSDLFCNRLSAYRGGLMKLGQTLNTMAMASPKFTHPWQRVDWSLNIDFNQSPTEALTKDLPGWETRLASVSDLPIGVGSISQVFHGRLVNGNEVALKIKYPDVDTWFMEDLKLLRLIKPFVQFMLPSAKAEDLLGAAEGLFLTELDFVKEVAWQKRLGSLFAADDGVLIPKIHDDLTAPSIIAMDYIEGRPLFPDAHDLPEESRQKIAMTIMRFIFKTLIEAKAFSSDPHPGNFLLTPDEKVAFIDFGAMHQFSDDFVTGWLEIIKGVQRKDKRRVREAFGQLGYFAKTANVDQNELLAAAIVVVEPLARDEVFCLDRSYLRKVSDIQLQAKKLQQAFSPPAEGVALIRMTWGLFAILAELSPKANFYRIVEPYLGD